MSKFQLPVHNTYLGPAKSKLNEYNIINDEVIHYHKNVKLHQFNMGDVEDPEIYAAHPIYEWQQTDYGKWCMTNAVDVRYSISLDHNTYGYKAVISGDLEDKMYTFWLLKYNDYRSTR